ncbi:Glu/Leu/Phe/Val family dehydrogenase [Actinomadura madurae]|uniref:Glu/Leu/Phe/Val family dehydrogenase n=1 Tax=Actinomadura madurae TaxID=1993 RepID=UPI002026AE64|nr:Glu/Leu/Phe/Val dehydrogenase [Actinomadura madurae]MCP9947480.1 Glu/Leu/Phe/Val dehydrogenase [Actinomadura madurae]MCQ0011781.1 Glu/Leu/Phe/Val dehydrogenase [Actinomadura madurae]URN03872.1 Glu/Leu/Phe/Val dehydrogenase [Actinomadura madurae]
MSDVLTLMDEWGPERVVCVSDTRTGMRGVLVIDNTARGMGKGGMRMSPTVTVAEVARLARVMTYKWAGVDLFFGGAKAGIAADPASPDREAILRSFVRALAQEIPRRYVAGLDMGLSERDAAIVQDELDDRGAAVGTPHALGGMPYDELGVTGFGVAEAADAAARHAGTSLRGARVVVQGFGAVGHAAARRLDELGAAVVAVSTVHGALYDPDGLDVGKLLGLRAEAGDAAVKEYGGRLLDVGAELTVPADVLVPAALQDVVDERVAADVQARIVVEGANLPTGPEAQRVLAERGVTVVPDFVANAGGVVAAGFAMDARHSAFRPDPDAVFTAVSAKMRENTVTVLDAARAQRTTTHRAAVALAQERVRAAMELKGRWRR